ncbi:MAG TPA: DUF6754 domain-containing protein [Anaerolineae bacterium]|nr:DUF6754 domain-containing protein [Anaerolineae bacterium]
MIIQLLLQIALVVIALSLPIAMLVFSTSARRARVPQMRPLSAFDVLRGQVGRGIETGRPAHISIGVGGIVGDDTLVTLAGASIVDSLAPEAAETGAAPTVTVADGAAMILAQDTLRRPYARRGDLAGYDPRDVQLLGMQPFQYAAGAMDFLAHAQPVSNVMVGAFGPEAGLIVEEGVKQGLTQVAGSTDARSLAVLFPSANHLLVGEEVFAAPAYLDQRPGHIARLQAQDLVRFIVAAVIVIWSILLLFA